MCFEQIKAALNCNNSFVKSIFSVELHEDKQLDQYVHVDCLSLALNKTPIFHDFLFSGP